MIKIGITGSLASGKSTVARMISSGKYPLYNADKVVKKIYQTNIFRTKVFKKFKLKNKKNIKTKIKKIISTDKKSLKDLEKIIHPLVRKQIRKFIKNNKGNKFLIFEIPLLVESKQMKNYDKIIFVNSRKDLRLKRYLKRGNNKRFFDLLNKRQFSPAKKIKFCDHVINNNGSIKLLKKNIKNIILKL
ncbi:MAG: dephospho-CoA kinase [Gammaproteobacteria bacterium TMED34]|nr:MAG: dephospho-CoA kinase [Gammaproteobacteria bacterium TMED34]